MWQIHWRAAGWKALGSSPYVCASKYPQNGLKYAIFSLPNMLLWTRMSHSHDVTVCDSAKNVTFFVKLFRRTAGSRNVYSEL